jgi:hypothetical protein
MFIILKFSRRAKVVDWKFDKEFSSIQVVNSVGKPATFPAGAGGRGGQK